MAVTLACYADGFWVPVSPISSLLKMLQKVSSKSLHKAEVPSVVNFQKDLKEPEAYFEPSRTFTMEVFLQK